MMYQPESSTRSKAATSSARCCSCTDFRSRKGTMSDAHLERVGQETGIALHGLTDRRVRQRVLDLDIVLRDPLGAETLVEGADALIREVDLKVRIRKAQGIEGIRVHHQ